MIDQNSGISISIIIVNYNSGSLLKECLASIFEKVDDNYEIIIYDNASTDDSLKIVSDSYPCDSRIIVMMGRENLGFAKANNLAANKANGKYLHFLNPDIVVSAFLSRDYQTVINGNINMVYVTSLVDEQGRTLKTKYLIPTFVNYFNRIFQKERIAFWNIGASLIISNEAFALIGGWPEDYFMYAEDLDLFYRIYMHKLAITYLETRLFHIGKGTTKNIWSERERAIKVEISFRQFYRKYGIFWQYFLLRPIHLVYILFNEPKSFILSLKTFIRTIFSGSL